MTPKILAVAPRFAAAVCMTLTLALNASAPAQSPPSGEAALPFRERIEPLLKALEFLQFQFQIDSRSNVVNLGFGTEVYVNARGHRGVDLTFSEFKLGDRTWYQLKAPAFASLRQCRFPSAARRALLEAGAKVPTDVQFLSNDLTGTVDAQVAIPVQDGEVNAALLNDYLSMMLLAIDAVWPVLDRAMDTGFIDWPCDDEGPKKPEGTLSLEAADGKEVEIGWTPWIEPTIHASTLIAAERLLRKFTLADDVAREAMGRELCDDFGGGFNLSTYAMWMRGAHYAEQHYPPVSLRFWGPPGTEVKASVRIPGYAGVTKGTQTIDAMGMRDIDLLPDWNRQALAAVREPTQATVEFTVECAGKTATGSRQVTILPSEVVETQLPLLPAAIMVNEDHPWVRGLIGEAKQLGVCPSLGYTGKESFTDCVKQVYAVWKAFRNRGLSYVAIQNRTEASGESPTQIIRPLHEAIQESAANCADGTAALASVLLRLGFDVHLICPPGHVFLGVFVPSKNDEPKWICVETTRLGAVEAEPDGDSPVATVESSIPERLRGEDWRAFVSACEAADSQLRDEPAVISIRALRERGLQTIPAPGGLGALPKPVAPEELERQRQGLREEQRRQKAQFQAKLAFVKDHPTRPYESLDRMREDLDAVERDPEALTRLLASVDGSQNPAVWARALGWTMEQLLPADRAAAERFGVLAGHARESLGVSGFPWDIETQPSSKDPTLFRLAVTPRDHESPASWIAAHQVDGRWHMTAQSLSSDDSLPLVIVCYSVGAGEDGQDFRAVADSLRADLEAGAFASAADYAKAREERLQKVIRPAMDRVEAAAGHAPQTAPAADSGSSQDAKPPAPPQAPPVASSADLTPGRGPTARPGDLVHYHYQCALSDGRPVFDSRGSGKPRSRQAGATMEPQGLSDALVGVRAGMHRRLVLPPDRAYGERGSPSANIPPNATLVFDLYIDRIGD